MKTAIYIRVSTEEQAKEGYSISAQKQRLKAFCIAQDWEVVGMYVDEGISAKNMERPNLQQMLKDIELGKVECVLVYRLDRLTRSVLDLYKMLEIFEKHNCKFKSATEVYDTTTAMGRMFITIVAALAQWERENMGERISMGYAEKVRQGKYGLNFRPFGYNLDLKTGKLTINKKEAKIVRLIFDLYLNGKGVNQICKYLNDRNISTRDGNTWNDKPLMQMLKNPLYKGSTRWKDFTVNNTHEPIISEDLFEQVQKTIEDRRTTEPRRVSSRYIFSGKIKCLKCGSPLVGYYTTGKLANGETIKYPQYRCLKKKTGQCIGSSSVSEKRLEEEFISFLEKRQFEQQYERVIEKGSIEKRGIAIETDLTELKKELEKLEARKKKWQYAWSEDLITDDDFRKRMSEAKKEEEILREQINALEDKEENDTLSFDSEQIKKVLKNIRKNWDQLDQHEKKNLINSIIKEIKYNIKKNGNQNIITIESMEYV